LLPLRQPVQAGHHLALLAICLALLANIDASELVERNNSARLMPIEPTPLIDLTQEFYSIPFP
jgi:hypothetical protein